jgi:hypothetical protein
LIFYWLEIVFVVFLVAGELAKVQILIMPTVGKVVARPIQQTLVCCAAGTIE